MLFNSYPFLFVFLPIALVGYQIAGHFHRRAVVAWLGLVSLGFYAYWRPALLYILISSIALNYLAAALISRQIPNRVPSRVWLTLAIVLDLSALGYFKYLFPSLNFLSSAISSSRHWADVILPLGISFFTFTQIAYLIDLHQGVAQQQDIVSYVLFVTFFPHLIAGPILHHKEMMPQFQQDRSYRLDPSDVAVGFSWFIMGAMKKVLLADNFATISNEFFNTHQTLSAGSAWVGALTYCLELYFDFSGYSDMALGLARMFSINFPLNFNSPFKAASIIDFWQRWHMTLSHYIMAYLYTPLVIWARERRQAKGKSVSRKAMATPGAFAQLIAFPMMVTLFIAGVWHGAGFQFIIYGLLHGSYLVVNHAWRIFRPKRAADAVEPPLTAHLKHAGSVLVTFLCVMVSFVFFRSENVHHAASILVAMTGLGHPGTFDPHGLRSKSIKIALGLAICWFLPNTQQILSAYRPSLDRDAWEQGGPMPWLRWRPSTAWSIALGVVFFATLTMLEQPSTFLYFQF